MIVKPRLYVTATRADLFSGHIQIRTMMVGGSSTGTGAGFGVLLIPTPYRILIRVSRSFFFSASFLALATLALSALTLGVGLIGVN